MPQFLDTFIEQVRAKRETIRQKMMVGRVSELDAALGDLIRQNWHPIADVDAPEREIVAVDGSRAIRLFASGAVLYIARALALYGKQSFRELEVDSFLCKAKSTDIEVIVNTRMEWLEFKVAIKAIKKADLSKVAILLDGSLYGRLTHLPRDQPAEGMRAFMIDYFETFFELLELCRRRQILILGVSKDSRSSFLRNLLLTSIFDEEVKNLKDVSSSHKKELFRIFEDAFDKPSSAFNAFRKLKKVYGDDLRKIEHILDEAIAARSDHQLIRNYIDTPGHTIPIELSVSRRGSARLKQIENNPGAYVRKYFQESLLETSDEEAFIDRAAGIVSKIPHFPSMVSFHVLLDPRDTPIRVDTPSWTYMIEHKISDFVGGRSVLLNINNIISLLLKGYAGLKDYNIWLKRVDEEVRLSRDTVDRLYSSALEKLLDFTIIHTRGYRRVKYP